MTFSTIFLQAQQAAGSSWAFPLMMLGMIVVMYFFMIRPQQKRAKEQKKFQESMSTGAKIVTTSGIHGRIQRVNEDGTILVEIDRNTNVTLERQAISSELTQAYLKKHGNATATPAATTPAS